MTNKSIPLLLLVFMAFYGGFAYSQIPTTSQTVAAPGLSLPGAESKVYKTIGATRLLLHIFQPVKSKAGDRRPAIIFFFGGGWRFGSVGQFVSHSTYLAERGMVSIVADYRVKERHGTTPFEGVGDAKSAIRWLRTNAAELGIDPKRIVASGGSAGGHLAASTALLTGLDEMSENLKISSVPNALVLFNPALDLSDLMERLPAMAALFSGDGKRAADISPARYVRKHAPPTLIFHGTADTIVPFEQATRFCEAMKKHGNRCEIVPFEGRSHGFFNDGSGDNSDYRATMRKTLEFLVSLKYIKPGTIK